MRIPGPGFRILAAAAAVALAGACASPPGPGGGTPPPAVRVLLSHDPPSLSLIGKTDSNTERIAVQITDSLVQYDPAMRLVPRVAESWEFSADGHVLTFHLRPGVRWHDGRPVTADDVLFTVAQVRDPAVESTTWLPLFRDLAALEAPDERTVRARYDPVTPDVLEAWRVPLLPRHRAEAGAALIAGEFARHPVGCGPYKFVRYVPGEEIVLEANDDYWDGRPSIERLVARIYRDQRTALQALLVGDIDVMAVTPEMWKQVRDSGEGAQLAEFFYSRTALWYLGWNMDGSNPFFDDVRVRQAMMLALDRETFVEQVLHGLARLATTSFHPDLPWTDPALPPLPHDPARAEALLDAAGWRRPARGGTRERDGKPFRFTLTIVASTQQMNDQMAAWLQQSWAELGLRCEIEKLEWNHFRERRAAGEFEATMTGFTATPSPDHFELYHSSQRREGVNYGGLADAEVDRLLELGRTTFDPDRRKTVYFELQRRLRELQPLGYLFHFVTPVLHDRRLTGIEPAPLDFWQTTRGPRVWRWAGDGPGG